MAAPGLRMALELSRRRAALLLHPPGASPYLALLLAIAGFEAGLTTANTVAEVRAVRILFTDGLQAFVTGLRSLPNPTPDSLLVSAVLVALALFTLGGWISTCFAVVLGQEPGLAEWNQGLLRSWRATVFALMGAAVVVAVLLVGMLGGVMLRLAMTSEGLPATAMTGAWLQQLPAPVQLMGLKALGSILMGGAIALGVSAVGQLGLMMVVAVLEPQTALWRVPGRARTLFQAPLQWRFVSRLMALGLGWYGLKLALLQLIVPFQPVDGLVSRAFAVFGSTLNGLLTIGDGLVALLAIVMAVQLYGERARPENR